MPYVTTVSILTALKAQLESIDHPTLAGQKLFERVEFHENKNLGEALTDLVVIKQRVAIIVPGGSSFQNFSEGRSRRRVRTKTFDLLIADRAWTKGGHAAVFGGTNNVGVLTMEDLVVDHLDAHCQLGLAYVELTPEESAHLQLKPAEKDVPGRECIALSYSTPAGENTVTPTAAWPA